MKSATMRYWGQNFITRVELHPPRLSPVLSPKTAIHGYSFTWTNDDSMPSFLKHSQLLREKLLIWNFSNIALASLGSVTIVTSQVFHLGLVSADNSLCLLYSASAAPIGSAHSCINQARLDFLTSWRRHTENTQTQAHRVEATGAKHISQRQNTSGGLTCKKMNGH